MPESAVAAAVLDTSVLIDLEAVDPRLLPAQALITAVTLAELSAGPSAAPDPIEAARRQDRLQRIEATFEPIEFGREAARSFGLVSAAVRAVGRQPRARTADLFIACIAIAEGLPLMTRKPDDFRGLEGLLDVIAV